MNKPLWGLALGLLALTCLPALPPWWWPALVAAALLAASWRWHRLLPMALFCAGLGWSVFYANRALESRLPPAWEGQTLEVIGRVVDLPEATSDGGLRFRLQAECEPTLEEGCGWARLRWQLTAREGLVLRPGERWVFSARLKRPHGFASPGAFDYEGWLLQEGVGATGYVLEGRRLAPAGFSIDAYRLAIRERFQRSFGSQPEAGVLLALLTGDRALVPDAAWERYAATGVTHLMAISGPHITLIAVIVAFLVRLLLARIPGLALRLPLQSLSLLAGFAAALAYSLLAGFSLPTQRTLIMLGVVVWALWRRRELSAFAVLLRALVLVLLVQPLAVHAAGFWLSFMAVALLMLLAWPRHGEPFWREFGRSQLIVTFGLLPLTLAVFARLSLVSPLANVLAIPLITFVVVPLGWLGLLLGLVWPAAGQGCWQAGIWVLQGLDGVLGQMASWSWSSFYWTLPPWGLLWLGLAMACLLLPRGLPGRYLLPFFLLPLCWGREPLPEGAWRFALLDVGQGLATVVQTRNHVLVYDTGPRLGPSADSGGRVLLPYLRWAGVGRIDTLLLSHNDADHTGGAASLLAGLPAKLVLGAAPEGLPPGLNHRACLAGQGWTWDGVRFEMLYPRFGLESLPDNERSCVLRISGAGHSLLLPGDLERLGEAALEEGDAGALKADLLVLAHHGSATSSGASFLGAVQAREALVSAGYRNRFHHPSPQVLERLQSLATPVRSTVISGSLIYDFRPAAASMPPVEWRSSAGHYWMTRP